MLGGLLLLMSDMAWSIHTHTLVSVSGWRLKERSVANMAGGENKNYKYFMYSSLYSEQ